MSEEEYINLTDRVKVSNAIVALNQITPEASSVINSEDYYFIKNILIRWEARLFEKTEVTTHQK